MQIGGQRSRLDNPLLEQAQAKDNDCWMNPISEWVLRELHEGMCGNHSGGRSLAHQALTQGYFWLYMARDAEQYGMNIVGSLPRAPGSNKFVILATNYFIKWVEAEVYVSVT
ncbi:hypothetical protein ACFX1Q_030654 [Malus domestica]